MASQQILARAVHKKSIDGIEYTAVAWPALQALRMGVRLGHGMGDFSLTVLLRAFGVKRPPDGAQKDVPVEDADGILDDYHSRSQALAMLLTECKDAELIRDCFKEVTADKVQVGAQAIVGSVYEHFDTHFAGRLQHMVAVMGWVVKVSFTLASE